MQVRNDLRSCAVPCHDCKHVHNVMSPSAASSVLRMCCGRRRPPDERTQTFKSVFKYRPPCRLETGIDDCVAAATATVASYGHSKQIIKNINQLALVLGLHKVEDAVVSREHTYSLYNLRRTAVTSSVQITCLEKNLNASRPSVHPTVRRRNVPTFRWDHRLQRQNLFMALFKEESERI